MFRDHWSAWLSRQAGLVKHPFQKDLKVHRGLENNREENKIKNQARHNRSQSRGWNVRESEER